MNNINKEKLAKFYLNYRLYIFPAIVALSSLIIIIFVIYPQISSLINSSKLEENYKTKSKFLEAKAQILENYDEVDLNHKVEFALGSLPQEKDFSAVVGLLQKIAGQAGFTILSLAVGPGSGIKSADSENYIVKLEMLGPKRLLPTLISSIENSARIMRMNSVEQTSTKESDVVTASLTVEVLYSSVPATFGSVDSPLPTLSDKDNELITKLTSSGVSTPSFQAPSGPRGKANPFE